MTVFPYHMRELDEVRGDLLHIEEAEGGLLARIGAVHVLLPQELTEELAGMVGRNIGILRLSGYHIRQVD